MAGDLPDADLVRRFLTGPDAVSQAALAALVDRHGPMVLRSCRQILGDSHDAEDAFQATFMILARKAGSVRRAESLAGWLHGVALRVAVRSRANAARRKRFERRAAAMKFQESGNEERAPESWPELHDEIARLPRRYREPVELCYLEGLSTEAAALRIGCPRGTILSRLSRARERLKGRLTRRGLGSPATLLAATATSEAANAALPALPAALCDATIRGALEFSARTSAAMATNSATTLAQEVLDAMTISHFKALGAAALILGFIGLGAEVFIARVPLPPVRTLPPPNHQALWRPEGSTLAQTTWSASPVWTSTSLWYNRPVFDFKLIQNKQ